MSRLKLGDAGRDASIPNDRRNRVDRRRSEPHDNVFLLHGTETRLQFAARAVGFGTYDLDSASGDIHWSPELKAIAGLEPDDTPMSPERIADLIHPDDRERVMASFAASLDPHRQAAEFDEECRLLRPDGGVRQVRLKGRTLFHGHGNTRQLLGATGVAIEITASRAADELLLQQARLLDLAAEPLLAWDQRHGIVFWNSACERAFGYRREEALGRPCHELLQAGFPVSRQACLAELARSGRWSGQVLYTARDGRRLTVDSRLERVQHQGRVSILEADRVGAPDEAR